MKNSLELELQLKIKRVIISLTFRLIDFYLLDNIQKPLSNTVKGLISISQTADSTRLFPSSFNRCCIL